jgi:hypothetical protein
VPWRYSSHAATGGRAWVRCPVMIGGLGAVDDLQELRQGRSGRRQGPRSTSRSVPKARLPAHAECERPRQPAAHAQRGYPEPGAISSPNAPQGRRHARRLRESPCRGRRPSLRRPSSRTRGRSPSPAHRGRNGGFGRGRRAATRSGCLAPPHRYLCSPHRQRAELVEGSAIGTVVAAACRPDCMSFHRFKLRSAPGGSRGTEALWNHMISWLLTVT